MVGLRPITSESWVPRLIKVLTTVLSGVNWPTTMKVEVSPRSCTNAKRKRVKYTFSLEKTRRTRDQEIGRISLQYLVSLDFWPSHTSLVEQGKKVKYLLQVPPLFRTGSGVPVNYDRVGGRLRVWVQKE